MFGIMEFNPNFDVFFWSSLGCLLLGIVYLVFHKSVDKVMAKVDEHSNGRTANH